MQSTNSSGLRKKKIDFVHEPDLLDWQIMWIGDNIPYGADICAVSVFLSERGQEVGIEIEYKDEGCERVAQGFIN